MNDAPFILRCFDCGHTHPPEEIRYRCHCGGTLDVEHDLRRVSQQASFDLFDRRLGARWPEDRSGVWRYRELILPFVDVDLVCRGEGNTGLYESPGIAAYASVKRLALKHEGENPTGSFKDRGMCVGVTMAKRLGCARVACASTGNTSASLAAYAAVSGLDGVVFIPSGKIAFGKLSQALAYGATTLQIEGDFDDAMRLVQEVSNRAGIYLLNSVNPFRIEGQKAILFELLQDRGWTVPDWIVLPGGNLGNSSAIGKALIELKTLGWIERLPRLAVIQAHGANPLYRMVHEGLERLVPVRGAETVATAIRIGDPVSWKKCRRALEATNGVVEEVTDEEILAAKRVVDAAGIGAEPASCATVAGLKKLVESGVVDPEADICGILTGHVLKDPQVVVDAHRDDLVSVEMDIEAILAALNR
ncbi:MAG: threonine synthase [Planctomycetota bacterium]